MGVGRVSTAAGLEHEPVHAGQLAQDHVEAVDRRQHALQRVLGLQRVQLGQPALRRLLGRGRWYFMVQVPKRLMFSIPCVSWLSRR